MISHAIRKLNTINPWHFLWITVLFAEAFTLILNSLQSLMRWGYISRDLIEIGIIDALVSSFILASVVIYLLKAANEKLKQEIAENRVFADALQKSETQLRSTLEATADGILAVDNSGKVTLANRRFAELWRIPQTLMEREDDQALLNFVLEQLTDADAFLNRVKSLYGSDAVDMDTLTFKDGRVFERYSFPMNMDGAGIGRVWSFRDITERKRAEDKLRESEAAYRTLAENIPDIVYRVYLQATGMLFFNDRIFNITGYRKEELEQDCICCMESNIVEEDRQRVIDTVQKAIRSRSPFEAEYRYRHRNGSIITLLERSTVVCDKAGDPLYIDGVIQDITGRRHTEEELNKYRDHLEEIVEERTKELSVLNDQLRQSQKLEAVGLLAGGIAHDFSNILTTIKGSAHLIQKQLDSNSPLINYAGQILLSLRKASNLTQSLLAFSRKQTVSFKPLDFNDIIGSSVKLLSQLIGEHIELNVELTDRKPTIMAERSQIEQVLLNLATNARDAMPKGGALTVQTEMIEMDEVFRNKHGYGVPGQFVRLTVSDTGTGIDEEIKGKIFEPFFTTKELNKGSGLGLALTYGIVKQHGGYIDVETLLRKGTTFKIYFPVVTITALSPEMPDISSAAVRGETILLAEDDADAREIMAAVLRMAGYRVIEAKDGEDAIRLFRDEKDAVNLVFLDVRMPKKDGSEVYKEIMKTGSEPAVLFISGYTKDIIDSQRIIEQGLNFISKTASPEEILKKIRDLLDKQDSG